MKKTFFEIRTKGKLLAGASLISLAMVTSVSAQDSTWWASAEGAAMTRDGDGVYTKELYLNPESSVSYAAEVGYNAPGSAWSYSIGVRHTSSSDDGYYYDNGWGTDDAEVTETITTIDLEIGRDIGIGSFEGRGTLGVRHLGYDATVEGYYYNDWYDGDDADYKNTSSFSGIGPRLAVEGEFPLANKLSIDAEVGVAVLFGTRTETYEVSNHSDGDDHSGSYDYDEIVSTADASLAVSYQIGGASKVSLGYRMDMYTNLTNSGGKGGGSDALIHSGAFLKYALEF